MLTGSAFTRYTDWVCPSSGFTSKLESSSSKLRMLLGACEQNGCGRTRPRLHGPSGGDPSKARPPPTPHFLPPPRSRRRHRCRIYPAAVPATAATTGAGAAAATGPEPASLLARRRHRYPTPSSPPPPTSFPSPRSRRRRRRRRFPAALATTGAGAAAATGPEPAPPTTGGSGGRIWGRGNKNTLAYPVPEQDMQKKVQSSSTPRRSGSAQNRIEYPAG